MSRADARATAVLVAGRGLGSAAALLIPVVLARVFAPEEFGTYKQLMLVYSTLLLLAPFGLAESLFYFVPRGGRRAGGYVANALLSLLLVGGLACAALSAQGARLAGFLGNPALLPLLGPLALLVALGVAATPLEIVMIARGRPAAAARCYGLSDLVKAAAMIAPALLLGRLDLVLQAALAFSALRLLATLAWCARELRAGFRPAPGLLAEQLRYALPFGAAAALENLQASLHLYAVGHAFDAAAFAVYAVGCLQVPLVDLVTGSAGSVLMVRLAGEPGREAAAAAWTETIARMAFLLFPLVAWLEAVAPDVIAVLYPPSYLASVPVFRVFCLTILLGALPTDAVLRARAQTRFLLLANAARLLLVIVAIGWCLGAFGLAGGALATLLAAAAAKAASLARVRRLLETGPGRLLPWRRLCGLALASTAAALVTLLWRATTLASPWPSLLGASLLYAACYLALVWLLDGARGLARLRSVAAGAGRAG
ncbi:MAG: lipopolysaccharide biosynthesis protein [Vicinamibacteria bacterium]